MCAQAIRDENFVTVALGVSNADATVPLPFKIDSTTGRVLVDASGAGMSVETPTGTVNGVNLVFTASANPSMVIIDGMARFDGAGVTITGSGPYTITCNPLNPPTEYIRSIS